MKNHLIPFMFVATLLLSVMACNKEDVNSFKAEEIALSTDVKPNLLNADLVFQLSEIDLTSGHETGWVIDQGGVVRGYEVTKAVSEAGVIRNEILTTTQMNDLNTVAQKVLFEVSEDELDAMSSLIGQVDANALSDTEKGPDESSVTTIYAYRLMADENTEQWQEEESYSTTDSKEESCGGQVHSNSYATAKNYERLVIKVSGASSKDNTSDASQSIGNWIADLNDNKNL